MKLIIKRKNEMWSKIMAYVIISCWFLNALFWLFVMLKDFKNGGKN